MSADHEPRRVELIVNVAVPLLLAVAVALIPTWLVAVAGLAVLVCALARAQEKKPSRRFHYMSANASLAHR